MSIAFFLATIHQLRIASFHSKNIFIFSDVQSRRGGRYQNKSIKYIINIFSNVRYENDVEHYVFFSDTSG